MTGRGGGDDDTANRRSGVGMESFFEDLYRLAFGTLSLGKRFRFPWFRFRFGYT